MLHNNLKIFIRHLRANKLYAFISIFSFAVSLMFVILLGVYIYNELSVDNFHKNKDRIYRLANEKFAFFAPTHAPLLKDKFPEIETYTRIYPYEGIISPREGEYFRFYSLLADSTFFKMFSFNLLEGSPETVLVEKNSIVLSKSFALKLFGKIPDIGTEIRIDKKYSFKITGIMENFSDNTHFEKVDFIIPFKHVEKIFNNKSILRSTSLYTFGAYLMTYKNTDIQSKVPQMLEAFKEADPAYKEGGYFKELFLEPLEEVYFSSREGQGTYNNTIMFCSVLVSIVLLILLLSITNYVNLTISQSGSRSKGAAIRKLVGGKKWSFVFQYVSESVILCLFSMCLALIMSVFAEPVVNNLLDTKLHLQDAFTWQFWIIVILFAILVGVLSGILPALKIASLNPISVVKGTFRMKEKRVYSRILICFQYTLIIGLLICAFFINKQTHYLKNFDLGFNKENLISIDNDLKQTQQQSFKSKILQYAGVQDVCLIRGGLLTSRRLSVMEVGGNSFHYNIFKVDTSFFRVMDIKIQLTGEAYSKSAILVTRSIFKEFAVPYDITSINNIPIYGIIDDLYPSRLSLKNLPSIFYVFNPHKHYATNIIIKLNGHNTLETINKIKEIYANFSGGLQPEIQFFDDTIAKRYDSAEKLGKIIMYFMLLTIIISVMGLFAMSMYYVQQKTKEVGIRKVHGATSREVLTLLNRDFVKWVFIAFIIAVPIAYYAMNKWLEDFPYKINLSWWVFALSGIFALLIALLTVSWQSYQAASRNPVKSLRYE